MLAENAERRDSSLEEIVVRGYKSQNQPTHLQVGDGHRCNVGIDCVGEIPLTTNTIPYTPMSFNILTLR
jgi:hypothetical protein